MFLLSLFFPSFFFSLILLPDILQQTLFLPLSLFASFLPSLSISHPLVLLLSCPNSFLSLVLPYALSLSFRAFNSYLPSLPSYFIYFSSHFSLLQQSNSYLDHPSLFSSSICFPFPVILPSPARISGALTFSEHRWTQPVLSGSPNTYRAIQTPIIGKRWPLRAHKQRLIKRATPRQTHLTAQKYESHTESPSVCS